jgi:hypothetical protein
LLMADKARGGRFKAWWVSLGLAATMSLVSYVLAFAAVPVELQVAYGALSACEAWGDELEQGSLDISRSPIWVLPIVGVGHLYGWKYRHFAAPSSFPNAAAGTTTPLHAILTVVDVARDCDDEMIRAMTRQIELGAPLDAYSTSGFTPLHEAILLAQPVFVDFFLRAGADVAVPVVRSGTLNGMTASQMARFLAERSDDPVRLDIAELVTNAGIERQ